MSDVGRQWPVAAFGPIGRARAMAASIPSAAWTEGILDAPYAVAWPWIADLAVSVPRFDTQVRKLRVLARRAEDGAERLRVAATTFGVACPLRRAARGRLLSHAGPGPYVPRPHGGRAPRRGARTRFMHLEAVPLPGTRLLRARLQRAVDADFRNLARLAAEGF